MKRTIASCLVLSELRLTISVRTVCPRSDGTSLPCATMRILPSLISCRPNGGAAQPISIWPDITAVSVPGGPPGTLTAVMSGQIDIGWAAPPFGLQEIKEGKIRIVAHGSDVPSLRGQTVRTLIVNLNSLKTKHDAIMRFMEAYREAVDWMYADPKAVEMYSVKMKLPVDLLKQSMDEFQPKATLQSDKFADLDGAARDAVKLKFLEKPLTTEQLAELLQIPPRQK